MRWPAPRPAAGAPARAVPGRGAREHAAAADAGLRAAEHLSPATGGHREMNPPAGARRIAVLPGDGIGPEVVAAAVRLLTELGEFEFVEHPVGGASIDQHGTALTDDVLNACRRSDAVLLGAVGGPKWDSTDPDAPRPEQGLLGLRKGLGLYANLRPVKPIEALLDSSPLRRDVIEGTDLLVVRELTGGIYFGRKERQPDSALDECVYDAGEITRIARTAFEAAQRRSSAGRVTSVDKANVLETSRLWREVVSGLAAEYADVTLDHLLVDN